MKEILNIVKVAKEILLKNGWCKGCMINMKNEHCLLGALTSACIHYQLPVDLIDNCKELNDELPKSFLKKDFVIFNDAVYTTEQDVLSYLDRVIAKLEGAAHV